MLQLNLTTDFIVELAKNKEVNMLWTVVAVLVVLWLLGFIGHIGGGLIHLLLVIALVVFIYRMITGRRAV